MINAKKKGNVYETEMAFRLREIFPGARTSRFMGRLWLDSCKVDLTDTDPYYFQCKATEHSPAYHQILSEMPRSNNHVNVILHKRNNRGTVAVLSFDDFLRILKQLQNGIKQRGT